MREIRCEIEIEAPAERVWQVLTDFDTYPDWNPFIKHISGQPKTDSRLKVRLEPPGGKGMTFSPRVLKVHRGRELRWLGHLWGIPRLFDGEHAFVIEPADGSRVRLIQTQIFQGLLLPLFSSTVDGAQRGLEEMNRAVKERAEAG